jgi:hypothetical protein
MHDLIILVADKNMQFALRGALSRPKAFGIRPITIEFIVHPNRDGGVRKTGPELLSLKRKAARHAVMLLDHEGSGAWADSLDLEMTLDARLIPVWGPASKSIVIAPELDVWMWGSDNVLQTVLEWNEQQPIRDWLRTQGFAFTAENKPTRPKEAMEALVQKLRQPRSSSLYEAIAAKVSLAHCSDPAFQKLRKQLQAWFPPT